MNALPDWPLMAIMVEHMEGQRDLILQKSVWHLNNDEIKNVCEYFLTQFFSLSPFILNGYDA